MIIDPKTHEVRAKLVLFGLPHSGKHQILENWSSEQGDGQLLKSQVGDSLVHRASFKWNHLPQQGWALKINAYTTEGEVSHSALSEMLLKDADGVAFVAPVDGDRAEAIRANIHELSEILKRHERSLSELPLALHYHQAEKVPGFQAQLLSDYLGVPRNTVPEVMTRSDDSSPLSASLALLLQQVIKLAEADLPQDEKGKQREQDAAAKTPSPPPSQLAGAEAT